MEKKAFPSLELQKKTKLATVVTSVFSKYFGEGEETNLPLLFFLLQKK